MAFIAGVLFLALAINSLVTGDETEFVVLIIICAHLCFLASAIAHTHRRAREALEATEQRLKRLETLAGIR